MLFIEKLKKVGESLSGGFRYFFGEECRKLRGEYRLILKDSVTGEVIERQNHNLIVNTASVLLARLLKDNKEPDAGISYLAVGTGASGWNLQNPPQPQVTQTKLESELIRKAFTTPDVTFIDPVTGDPTIVPTNVVDYTMTFAETEAVGPLVEMSLFGGDATDLADSGTMVNYRTFPVINKTSSMTLTIIFRITT